MTKRILSFLLVLVMVVLCLAGCNNPNNTPEGGEGEGNNGGGTTFTPATSYKDPTVYEALYKAGFVTTTKNTAGAGGTVNKTPYAGIAGKDYTDEKVYTYNDYLAATTGLNWNPLSWETNDDSYVLGYLGLGFYDFALNADKTGYAIVCEMAADYPVDVTAQYAGQFGIAEGDSAKAWKISLNPNAKWQNGDPITADDYIYSMQQQLDPHALYRRADSFYAGDFQLYNAKAYLYSGQKAWNDAFADGYDVTALDVAAGTVDGMPAQIAYAKALEWLGGDSLQTYVEYYGEAIFDMTAWAALVALDTDENGMVEVTADSVALLTSVITFSADWGETADDVISYMMYEYQYPVTPWEEVGLLKTGEYEIVFITVASTEEADFYVPYNLSSTWLVHEETFEASKKYYNAEKQETTADADDVAQVVSTYGTTLALTMSYGPYKMTAFQPDKQIKFERNENWYGYTDGNHLGQFQTDNINVTVIDKHETALLEFLNGNISGIGLQATDMDLYGSSDRIVYTPESYTSKLTFNTNYESLLALGGNQQLLAVQEFRAAFGLAIDREYFATQYTAAHLAGFGLLNNMYCYDPFTGELYRDSDYAKQALVDLFGLEYGEGKDFDDLDEAYNALTGYDLDQAKVLMQKAYDEAVAANIYDGTSAVKLVILVYNEEDIYVQMVNYFNEVLANATKGTSFEGKVTIELKIDADYYTSMNSGNAAIIFTTWGGAAMSPFTMLSQVYVDASDGSGNQNEYGFETQNVKMEIVVDGVEIVASLKQWADWCGSVEVPTLDEKLGKFTDYDYATRCAFFALCEKVYLESYATTALYYRNSASLVSYKIEYASKDYLQIVGYGTLRDITYNYDDATWETVKGTLDYTASSAE